jgi:TRAP-type transport system periplasmic protein
MAWRQFVSRGLLAGAVLLAAALGGPGAGTALAQQVTLKLHHFVPAQSNQQRYWFEPWAKKLEQESGGRLKVEIYPSMQLGGKQPQLYDQVRDGVVDIAWTVLGTTTPGRFPRFEALELPFVANAAGAKNAPAVSEFYQRFGKDS